MTPKKTPSFLPLRERATHKNKGNYVQQKKMINSYKNKIETLAVVFN